MSGEPIREEAMGKNVLCEACGYSGPVHSFPPAVSVYQDIRCPECGSTNNDFNAEYQKRLFARIREINEKEKP